MTINILLYIIIPLLPILRKVFKSTKKVLFIYYSIVILFWVIFYEKIISESSGFDDYLNIMSSIGIILFPLLYYMSINENKGVIEATEFLLFYVLYTIILILEFSLLATGSSSNEITIAIEIGNFFLSIYIFGIPLILAPMLIYDRIKNKFIIKKYTFKKYNSEYEDFFAFEKEKIIKTLGPDTKIEHIGSTSISGLGGKGIIDIIIGTKNPDLKKIKDKLEEAGYEFREKAGSRERLFFRIDYPYRNSKRRVHIHLVKLGSEDWENTIFFRDYLINNPKIAQEYAQLKRKAVKKANNDGKIYKKYKEKFIKNVLINAIK